MNPCTVDPKKQPGLAGLLDAIGELDDVVLALKVADAAAINVHGRFRLGDVKHWREGEPEQMLVLEGKGTTESGESLVHVHVDWTQVVSVNATHFKSPHSEFTYSLRVALCNSLGHELFWFYARELPKGYGLGVTRLATTPPAQ